MSKTNDLYTIPKQFHGNNFHIYIPKVYGYLRHEPTQVQWTCYKPIGKFKRLMLKWCFGLKYIKEIEPLKVKQPCQ